MLTAEAMPTIPTPTTVTLFLLPTGSSFITWPISFSLVDICGEKEVTGGGGRVSGGGGDVTVLTHFTDSNVGFSHLCHHCYKTDSNAIQFTFLQFYRLRFQRWFNGATCDFTAPFWVSLATTARKKNCSVSSCTADLGWRHTGLFLFPAGAAMAEST